MFKLILRFAECPHVWTNACAASGAHSNEIQTMKRRYFEMLRGLIGEVEPDHAPQDDPQVAAYALFGMMNWIYNWYNPAGPQSPEALAERFAQIFMFGLTPAPSTASQGG